VILQGNQVLSAGRKLSLPLNAAEQSCRRDNLHAHEIKTYCDYKRDCDLCYWRATSGFEIDFVITGKTAIEVKGKANITRKDFKGLTAIKEEELLKNYILVCLEDTPRKDGDICILPWKDFIMNLWQDTYE